MLGASSIFNYNHESENFSFSLKRYFIKHWNRVCFFLIMLDNCYHFLIQLHGYSVQFCSSIILFRATYLIHITITMGLCKRDHMKLVNNKTASWLCVNGILKVCFSKSYFFLRFKIADPRETKKYSILHHSST